MLAYVVNLAILICLNAILATTLNFIMGYAGIFSIAHAIFFGVGAYTAAYVATHATASFLVAVPAAMAVAGALSLALALPALRVRGEYFVAASLGLQVIGVTLFSEWKSVTGGLGGVLGIPPLEVLGHAFATPGEFLAVAAAWAARRPRAALAPAEPPQLPPFPAADRDRIDPADHLRHRHGRPHDLPP